MSIYYLELRECGTEEFDGLWLLRNIIGEIKPRKLK
jgi:hypothetical protein